MIVRHKQSEEVSANPAETILISTNTAMTFCTVRNGDDWIRPKSGTSVNDESS